MKSLCLKLRESNFPLFKVNRSRSQLFSTFFDFHELRQLINFIFNQQGTGNETLTFISYASSNSGIQRSHQTIELCSWSSSYSRKLLIDLAYKDALSIFVIINLASNRYWWNDLVLISRTPSFLRLSHFSTDNTATSSKSAFESNPTGSNQF